MRTSKAIMPILVSLLLVAYGYASVNMSLPAIPSLASEFHVSLNTVKLTISYYMFALAAGEVIWGFLADYQGRIRVVMIALLISVIGSIVTALSTDVGLFCAGRILEGLGAGVAVVYARLILTDHTTGNKLHLGMTYVVIIAALMPGIAPVIGGYLLAAIDWQSIFWVLVVFAMVMQFLSRRVYYHGHTENQVKRLSFDIVKADFKALFKCRAFVGNVLAFGCSLGMILTFYAVAPFIFITHLKISSSHYGYILLISGGAYLLGALCDGQLARKDKSRWGLFLGYGSLVIACITGIVFSIFAPLAVWSVMTPIFFVCFGGGFLSPAFSSKALDSAGKQRGLGSALTPFSAMLCSSICSAVLSPRLLEHLWSLGIFIIVLSVLSFVFFLWTRTGAAKDQELKA